MKAVVFALLSALVWGTAPLIFKIGLRGEIPPLVGIFFHNLTASLFALLFMLLLREGFSYPLRDIAVISFGGFVSGFLGLLLYYKAIKVGEVSVVAPIVASSPLWASLFAFMLLGESFTLQKFVGTLLVVLGVILITISR
ncbi:MAG: EamA family transporter [Aquificota bacterium]|nr:EamA family transporter [Aquificota bacterium]